MPFRVLLWLLQLCVCRLIDVEGALMTAFNDKRNCWRDFVCLFLLTCIVFGRALGHDFQGNWDDNWYVLLNPAVEGVTWEHVRDAFSNFYIGMYSPLQIISYMLDYSLWGLWPGGFILTNILLHFANGLMVYRLLLGWYEKRLVALFASAIFLIHPVQVESAVWISQRKSLLALFFFLAAWELYCRYRNTSAGMWSGVYVGSCTLFAVSLLAKPTTVVMPVVLVIYDRFFADEKRRSGYADKLPYILLAGIFSALTIYTQTPEVAEGGRSAYHGGGAMATFFTMLTVFCRYLGMLVWPAGLSAAYAPTIRQVPDMAVILSACLLAGIAVAAVKLYKLDRRLAFWVMFFWVGLLPVSQIVPVQSLLYDHYLYLPIIGAAALAGSAAGMLQERLETGRRYQLHLLLLAVVAVLSVVSFQRSAVWRNSLALWSDAVAKEPRSDLAWKILGGSLLNAGRFAEARDAYQRGLALNPANSEILHGLGMVYTELGEIEKGYKLLQRFLAVRPDYVTGWASLGSNRLKVGDYAEAEKAYRRALALQPEAWQVTVMLGDLEMQRRRPWEAASYYRHVETLGHGSAATAYGLACAEAMAGHADAGLQWLEIALKRGFDDFDTLWSDSRLSSLWEKPMFNQLILQYSGRQASGG